MTLAIARSTVSSAPTTNSDTLISRRPSGPCSRSDASSAIIVVEPIRRRIGMREAAADRAAVAHRTVGDAARQRAASARA